MTLKPGRQQKYFYQMLQLHFPHLIPYYDSLYSDNRWGNAKSEYYQSLSSTLFQLTRLHQIPPRIPAQLFNHLLNENDLVQVILEQMDYLLQIKGKQLHYAIAARSISKTNKPLSLIRTNLTALPGVGIFTAKLIQEILKTKTCQYYEDLLMG